jgi:hypothetical protein
MSKQRKKILVGTPMYGGQCYGVFVESLLNLQKVLFTNGHFMDFMYITNESLITRGRNEIVHTFMESDFDHLLFIDSDHRFDPMGILKMIEEEEDIICGIAPRKRINWASVKEANELKFNDLQFFTGEFVVELLEGAEIFYDKKFEIKYGGTGLMLVSRVVFEKLKSKTKSYKSDYGSHDTFEYFTTSIKDGKLLSEDYELCKNWRELGGKVYAVSYANMTHIGTYEFMGSIYATIDLNNKKNELSFNK